MVADGMLTRKRYREVPPRVDYELTDRSRELAPVLGDLARWGYSWAWGSPRTNERVDIGAIFRLIPGLAPHVSRLRAGTVAMTVTDGHAGGPALYRALFGDDGGAEIREGEGGRDAHIAGDTAAWVAALSPAADRGALQIDGDRGMADMLLGMLEAGESRAATALNGEGESLPRSA